MVAIGRLLRITVSGANADRKMHRHEDTGDRRLPALGRAGAPAVYRIVCYVEVYTILDILSKHSILYTYYFE